MTFLIYANTAEELRQVLISDLRRRVEALIMQREAFGRGAAGKARFDSRINELEDLVRYWAELQIVQITTKTRPKYKKEN